MAQENSVHGKVTFKDENVQFLGNETLYIAVRDSLRYDADCIELGSISLPLIKGQKLPIMYRCDFDPDRAHMTFAQIKSIPGGVTLSATVERNGQLLYTNHTDLPLAAEVNIELVRVE